MSNTATYTTLKKGSIPTLEVPNRTIDNFSITLIYNILKYYINNSVHISCYLKSFRSSLLRTCDEQKHYKLYNTVAIKTW